MRPRNREIKRDLWQSLLDVASSLLCIECMPLRPRGGIQVSRFLVTSSLVEDANVLRLDLVM